MAQQPTGGVYSFGDVVIAFASPLVNPMSFSGPLGTPRIVVAMTTVRTTHDIAADGAVMVSSIKGDNGHVTIETQQTSVIHQFFTEFMNQLIAAQGNNDVTNWATATLSIRSVTTNTGHVLTGLSPTKQPDTPYAAQGEHTTWEFMAANVANQ